MADAPPEEDGDSRPGRVLIILALFAAYVAITFLFTQVLDEPEAHAHFAYIPLVLAGLWWGHRGLVVALTFVVSLLLFHVTELTSFSWWTDVEMILSYLLVGALFGIVGERARRDRRRLWLSRQRYHQLVERSRIGIVVYADETIRFVNPRMAQLLGLSPEALVDRPIWDLIHPDDLDKVKARFRDREDRGYADLDYEARFARVDGSPQWVRVASTKMTFDGRVSVQMNVSDISSRKSAQEREAQLRVVAQEQEEQLVHSARLAELGELAASVAHEVNQPLTGIRNYARNAVYILEHNAGEAGDVEENLNKIAKQVDRAAEIIRTLQQLSRRSTRDMEPIDINDVVRECLGLLEAKARLAGIAVALHLGADLPQPSGDRVRIEQVVLNLLTNAIHSLEEVDVRHLHVATTHDIDNTVVIGM